MSHWELDPRTDCESRFLPGVTLYSYLFADIRNCSMPAPYSESIYNGKRKHCPSKKRFWLLWVHDLFNSVQKIKNIFERNTDTFLQTNSLTITESHERSDVIKRTLWQILQHVEGKNRTCTKRTALDEFQPWLLKKIIQLCASYSRTVKTWFYRKREGFVKNHYRPGFKFQLYLSCDLGAMPLLLWDTFWRL